MVEIDSRDLKQKVLYWVMGTEGLSLIYNCLGGEYLDVRHYENVYDLVISGLKGGREDGEKRIEAIDVLLRCIMLTDYDDVQSLLTQKSSILTNLLMFLQRVCNNFNEFAYTRFLKTIGKAINCVLILLQTY